MNENHYLRMLPVVKTHSSLGFLTLYTLDDIYKYVDVDAENYPCGLFFTENNASVIYSLLFHRGPLDISFINSSKSCYTTIECMYFSRNGKGVPSSDVPQNLIHSGTYRYSDIMHTFKFNDYGFYCIDRDYIHPYETDDSYKVHVLRREDVAEMFNNDPDGLYEFMDRYAFIRDTDNQIEYIFDEDLSTLIEHIEGHVEHFFIDDASEPNINPELANTCILLKSMNDLDKVVEYLSSKDITYIPFYSSQCEEKTNQILNKHKSIFKTLCTYDDSPFEIEVNEDGYYNKNAYSVKFNALNTSKELIHKLLKAGLIWEYTDTSKTNKYTGDKSILSEYGMDERFLRWLKLTDQKTLESVWRITIYKNVLDNKEE